MCLKISTRILHPGFSKPSSSSSLPGRKTAAKRSRILRLLIIVVVATPLNNAKGGDVSSWVHSSHRVGYNDLGEAESLYLGIGGNPWGSASTSIYLRNHRRTLSSLELRNGSAVVASRNDNNDNGAATEYAVISGPRSTLRRSKRGVLHLYNMVLCATGCNPLAYKGYGCYCGFLGSGFTIDGIDRCCKMHDWCYEATNCMMFSEYFVPYYWKCYRGYKPICAVEHGDLGAAGSCAQRLCECDRALAECLRRYPCPRTKAMCTSSLRRLVQNIFMLL